MTNQGTTDKNELKLTLVQYVEWQLLIIIIIIAIIHTITRRSNIIKEFILML